MNEQQHALNKMYKHNIVSQHTDIVLTYGKLVHECGCALPAQATHPQ